MNPYQPLVTIAIPSYNAARFIRPTLDSITWQTYPHYEVLVVDDGSTDATCDLIRQHGFSRLTLVKNEKNLGCMETIARCAALARGEILVFLCHDDILSPVAVERIVEAFSNPEIGATTRPYYWFIGEDIHTPNRVVRPIQHGKNTTITRDADYPTLQKLVETLGQISAMGFRKEFIKIPFSKDVFTVHGQAFLGILREHPVTYIGEYLVAVRTEMSQSRSLPAVYSKSPLGSWDSMFQLVFGEPRFRSALRHCRRAMATENDVGLVQVKCVGGQRSLLREIAISLRIWPLNALRPGFLFWSMVTLLTPRGLLRWSVDHLKNIIGPKTIKDVRLAECSVAASQNVS